MPPLVRKYRKRVVIFSDSPDWHGQNLKKQLLKSNLDARFASLSKCRIDINDNSVAIKIPGFANCLPDGAIVRLINKGTLEQITYWLGVLHALEKSGVTVYNSPKTIEKTVDKSMTSFLLNQAHLPTPPTWVCNSKKEAKEWAAKFLRKKERIVLKPMFGAEGKGIRLIEKMKELPNHEEVSGIYYLQKFIHSNAKQTMFKDWRIFVVGKKIVGTMKRSSESWLTNVSQGSECTRAKLNRKIESLAVKAAAVVEADYAGVDVMQDNKGRYYILEVNSIPAWKGLQSTVNINIASAIVKDFIKKIHSSDGRKLSNSKK
jgi:RimK family alpha-L-glutamate ligase